MFVDPVEQFEKIREINFFSSARSIRTINCFHEIFLKQTQWGKKLTVTCQIFRENVSTSNG